MGRRTKDSGRDGVLVIDKPAGITSHDVVSRCRRILGQQRSGHSGTLDPDATGVMLVGFGQGTKLLPFLTALGKSYTAEVVMGATTSTLDDSGEVLERFDMSGLTLDQVRAAAAQFLGDILQLPPMVSAVRVAGKRLHQYEREGIEVERTLRPVTVQRFDILEQVEPGVFSVAVTCGSGTYVRTLADDLGRALGGGAHLRRLRRTAVGPFTDDESVPLDQITAETTLLSLPDALRGRPMAGVDEATAALIRNGRVLPATVFGDAAGDVPWGVCGPDGALLAVYERYRSDEAKPVLVLTR